MESDSASDTVYSTVNYAGTSYEYTVYYKDAEKTIKHRLVGPAIEYKDGHKEYFINGKRHRLDGPAIETADRKEYWIEGKRHRLDGPAIERDNGDKEYWVKSLRHRIDGPAIEQANGYKEYWIDGCHKDAETFTALTQVKDLANEIQSLKEELTKLKALESVKPLTLEQTLLDILASGFKDKDSVSAMILESGENIKVLYVWDSKESELVGGDVNWLDSLPIPSHYACKKLSIGYASVEDLNELKQLSIIPRILVSKEQLLPNNDIPFLKRTGNISEFFKDLECTIRHNPNGPAYIAPNKIQYWVDGKLHRIDGPAESLGHVDAYFENGVSITLERWKEKYSAKQSKIATTVFRKKVAEDFQRMQANRTFVKKTLKDEMIEYRLGTTLEKYTTMDSTHAAKALFNQSYGIAGTAYNYFSSLPEDFGPSYVELTKDDYVNKIAEVFPLSEFEIQHYLSEQLDKTLTVATKFSNGKLQIHICANDLTAEEVFKKLPILSSKEKEKIVVHSDFQDEWEIYQRLVIWLDVQKIRHICYWQGLENNKFVIASEQDLTPAIEYLKSKNCPQKYLDIIHFETNGVRLNPPPPVKEPSLVPRVAVSQAKKLINKKLGMPGNISAQLVSYVAGSVFKDKYPEASKELRVSAIADLGSDIVSHLAKNFKQEIEKIEIPKSEEPIKEEIVLERLRVEVR